MSIVEDRPALSFPKLLARADALAEILVVWGANCLDASLRDRVRNIWPDLGAALDDAGEP